MRSTPAQAGREVTAGTATGVLNMALFGAVWIAAGTGGIGGAAGIVVLVVGWTLAAALCVGSVRLRRGADSLPHDDSSQARTHRERVLRRFNLVLGLEFVAIAVAVFLLVRLSLVSLIPSVVALIVGMHFFPLATLFEVRTYRLTGAVLCALALVVLLFAPESRLALVGIGSAATLFVTAAYMLFLGVKAT
jgi:hypothetical protein